MDEMDKTEAKDNIDNIAENQQEEQRAGETPMNRQIHERDVEAELEALRKKYDLVRLVNPEECHTFQVGKDRSYHYGPNCYSVWRSTNRCRNCTSLRALKTGMELRKTEIKDGDLYYIISRPIEILCEDGAVFPCVIEMLRIEKGKGMTKDNHHAVLHEGIDAQSFAEALRTSMQNLPTGMIWFNLEHECIYANSEAFRLFGVQDDLEKLGKILREWFQQGTFSSSDAATWIQKYGGKPDAAVFQICRYPLNDAQGKDIGTYFLISDCTQDQKNMDLEHFGTMHDGLMGIYNKYGFYRQARKNLEQYPDEKYLMVCSNFGDFKLLNGLYGMTKGNELLMRVGAMLRKHYGGDTRTAYGRIRADRFAMMVPDKLFDPDAFLKEIENIVHGQREIRFDLQITIGICRIEDALTPISVLCDRAFLAASMLKGQESNGYVWYSENMMSNRIRDRAILSRFEDALKNDEVQIFLQAQVDAKTHRVLGAEALSRWLRGDGRIIPPNLFVPILEEHGKIWQLDYYVWREACRLLKSWQHTELADRYISVNISVKDMYYLDLYGIFTDLVEEYEIPPEKLELEITETVFMDKPKEAISLIRRLKEYGFVIAIDDFGSGYSSLSFLKDIQADILKIDMGFLHKTEHQERSRIILKSVIALASELGMPTVVEGVETEQQVRDLTAIGCDIFQGFYFSQPIPVAEYIERFQDGTADVSQAGKSLSAGI